MSIARRASGTANRHRQRRSFDADRGALVHQLEAVGIAIRKGAIEMAMIAAEKVFDAAVSKILVAEARVMSRMVRRVRELQLAVVRASRSPSR